VRGGGRPCDRPGAPESGGRQSEVHIGGFAVDQHLVIVLDDGAGFDVPAADGFGLVALRQRVEALARAVRAARPR
jgi:glucose-6-phosphate-specific signal transduction histidine kinase